MTKYKAVEKAIQEANSDIMLKYCPDCDSELGVDEDDGTIFCGTCPIQYSDKSDACRPITLENVLIALEKENLDIAYSPNIGFIEIPDYTWSYINDKKNIYWMKDKPYSEQSKELHEFLWDLLCKNNTCYFCKQDENVKSMKKFNMRWCENCKREI